MEYYIFMWDMVESSAAVRADESKTLEYLGRLADFCLESVSELPKVQVEPTGDGQQVLFPDSGAKDLATIIKPFTESVERYSESLRGEFPNYSIRSILGVGSLASTPLGLNGQALWDLSDKLHSAKPGEYLEVL